MAQTPLFATIAELSALNVFTFLSSRFTVVHVPFKVVLPKTNQMTCHSFTGDLYIRLYAAVYVSHPLNTQQPAIQEAKSVSRT